MTLLSPTKPVILVVDDEALLRLNAIDLMEEAGFDAFESGNAEDALVQLDQHPEVSVLFTDIQMPGRFDGLELARQVHIRRPDIQLILTSGRRRPEPKDIPDDGKFIAKPYDGAAVARLVMEGRK